MIPTDGNLVRLLVRRVTEAPRLPLYHFLDRHGAVNVSFSRESLFYMACRLAALLQEHRTGSRPVALYYPHGPDFVIAFWAAVLAGSVPVPLTRTHSSGGRVGRQTSQSGSGLPRAMVEQSGAALVLTTNARSTAVSRDCAVPVIATDRIGAGGGRWEQPDPDASDIAFIQYTSGSTTAPRGVRISHGNTLDNGGAIHRAFDIRPGDTGVCWLPLHHDMGLIGHVIQPVYSGISNGFLSPTVFAARPARWLEAMDRLGGTISGGPDAGFALCNSRIEPEYIASLDLSRWRVAYCGAERIRRATHDRFARRLRVAGFDRRSLFPCYGLAESTLFVSGRHGLQTGPVPDSGASTHVASVGVCHGDGRLTVTDLQTGAVLPEERVGEIVVESGSVAGGYHRNPAASAERFVRSATGARPAVRTGDIGFLRGGELHVTGRVDNCIQYHGRNVFAEDIEAAVMAMEPVGVSRCAAFALESDGGDARVQVVIVLEHDGRAEWNEAEAHVSRVSGMVAMAVGMFPDDVQLWPRGGIPRTTSGKARRNHCRDLYLRSERKPSVDDQR